MNKPHILHLVDDTSAGGVTRFLDCLKSDEGMAQTAYHEVVAVGRGKLPKSLRADMIVSHLSVSWRTLPSLVTLRARVPNIPLVHVEHSYCEGFEDARVTRRGRFEALLRTAYALFDQVIAVSNAQADWLSGNGLVSAKSLRMISPVVDLKPFLAIEPHSGPIRKLGAIGRFDEQKGFDLLIQAFRDCDNRNIDLVLIGDGPERARLEALAASDPRISFRPFSETPATVVAEMDAIAMPSRWEPYGLVALEARAAGRPLLVAAVDGLKDHATAGAIAIPQEGVEAWTEALNALPDVQLTASCAKARENADGAKQLFVERWTDLIEAMLAPGDMRAA